jgi:hypothetical protein
MLGNAFHKAEEPSSTNKIGNKQYRLFYSEITMTQGPFDQKTISSLSTRSRILSSNQSNTLIVGYVRDFGFDKLVTHQSL